MMAGRTSENKWARRWGPHEPQQGSRRTNRSQHVGPFLLLRANMGLLLARGGGSDTSHDRCRGGSLGRHVGPRGAHTGGGGLAFASSVASLMVLVCIQPSQSRAQCITIHTPVRTSNLSFFFPCIFALVLRNSQGRPNIWNFVY